MFMNVLFEKSISSEAHKKCDSSSSIAVLKGEKIGVFPIFNYTQQCGFNPLSIWFLKRAVCAKSFWKKILA